MDIANHFPVNENTVRIYCSTMLLLPEIKETFASAHNFGRKNSYDAACIGAGEERLGEVRSSLVSTSVVDVTV
jgi:hypothetical protein